MLKSPCKAGSRTVSLSVWPTAGFFGDCQACIDIGDS